MKTLLNIPSVRIGAISELIEERAQQAAEVVREKAGYAPEIDADYRALLDRPEIDGVVIATSWNEHIPIAIDAMRAGKYTSFEVGGAPSVEQCWDLVKAYEATKTPCMILENCCYGRYELAVLNMIRQGLFGELIHCEGGYMHDLRAHITDYASGRQRILHHFKRNAELYPTHEIGPIAKYLDINRGNRFLTLTSTASHARGLNIMAEERANPGRPANHPYRLGDIVTTVLKCALGQTVTLTHDTSLPRPYSRGNSVRGTKGIWTEQGNTIYFDSGDDDAATHKWENMDDYLPKYEHPIWQEFLNSDVTDGHGGMDYLVLNAFIESVKNQAETPLDVYDAATWIAITSLSENSIAMGSMPVAVPDFTNGRWIMPRPAAKGKYALDD